MPKTLLAVDDSVTMRKVLEITFSGEDFRVITADSAQNAIGKLGDEPNVFVIDTTIGGEDGYALAKEFRRRSPAAPIIMLSSRYAPYDQARGRDAGVDDFADKPFDTQQLIDKVKKVVVAKEGATAPAPRAPMQPPQPMAGSAGALGRGTQPSLGSSAARTGTLMFGESPLAQPPAAPQAARPAAPAPAPPVARPQPVAAAPAAAHASAAVNGQLEGKLGELGLTPHQAQAVMALSREVVERVVWEVVPQMAEALIREELARLTRD